MHKNTTNLNFLPIRYLAALSLFLGLVFPGSVLVSQSSARSGEGTAKGYLDPDLGVYLPPTLGDLSQAKVTRYPDSSLGVSVAYKGPMVWADVYFYDLNLKAIPRGANSAQLNSHYNGIKTAILESVQEGQYKSVALISAQRSTMITDNGALELRGAAFEMTAADNPSGKAGVKLISHLLLTGYGGKFLKVRFTYPARYKHFGEKNLDRFMESLAGAIKDSVTPRVILNIIADFEKDPLSRRGDFIGAHIMGFAVRSDKISLNVERNLFSFMRSDIAPNYKRALLVGFVSGNVKSQILSGVKRNDSHAGMLSLFKVYRLIKVREPDFNLAEVETLVELEQAGKLKERLRQGEAARTDEETQETEKRKEKGGKDIPGDVKFPTEKSPLI